MSKNPNPTPVSGPRKSLGLVLSLVTLNLLVVGLGIITLAMRSELTSLRTESDKLRFAIDLLRHEATSQYEGKGFNALLDHLTYWGPQLQKANDSTLEFFQVEKRVQDVVDIMGQLPNVYPQIAAILREGGVTAEDPTTNDEIRKWLLRAAYASDPEKGQGLYAELLRADRDDVSARLRRIAVQALFEINKQLTGEILHEILNNENAKGIQRPGAQDSTASRRRGKQPQFYNFIDYYVASDHPAINTTLMQILNRPEHDLLTLQACAKYLGKRKVLRAVSRLKALYWEQHTPNAGRIPNPLFRMKLLNAVIEIEGSKAKDFLQDVDKKEGNPAIRTRLNELRKDFSF